MNKKIVLEIFVLILVIGSVIVPPAAIYAINRYYTVGKFPKNAQIINLYGVAKGGLWTQEPVTAFNYWWKDFKRAKEIHIKDDGTPVFFRVVSTDVMHSFAIPLYRLGPYDIKPGQVREIELKTDRRLRSTGFLCWQYCDKDHANMKGRIVVSSPGE